MPTCRKHWLNTVPGDKVTVKLVRDKKEKSVEVTLKNEQGTTKIVKDAGMEILGAAFKELPDDLKKQLNLGYGLQVTGVSSGKMSDAGVRKVYHPEGKRPADA